MKLSKSLIVMVLFMAINSVNAQSITDKWKQLGDFHELLSKTFHPTEEGDFRPIKQSSQELLTKSEALDVATMPQDLRNPSIEPVILVLKKQTKLVNELVKSKVPDPEIMRAFQNLHDIYYRIVYLGEPKKK
jgi:hypothetical protein